MSQVQAIDRAFGRVPLFGRAPAATRGAGSAASHAAASPMPSEPEMIHEFVASSGVTVRIWRVRNARRRR